jgi:hypothetical protein
MVRILSVGQSSGAITSLFFVLQDCNTIKNTMAKVEIVRIGKVFNDAAILLPISA